MSYLSQIDCCTMLGIDTQTLRHWCSSAHIQFRPHPMDERLQCLTLEQVQLLAQVHGLFPRATKPPPFVSEQSTLATLESLLAATASLQAELQKVSSAGLAQVMDLQKQLTQLIEEMRHPRDLHSEHHFSGLGAAPPAQPLPKRLILPVELQARPGGVIPCVQYRAVGSYVIKSPHEGEFLIVPDSSEWFDWLASLRSFRFFGKLGRFTAYRESHRGKFTRGWKAVLRLDKQSFRRYIGTTDRLTFAWLEEVAATLPSYKSGGS